MRIDRNDAASFVRYLRGLAHPQHPDRATLATLRRGLGKPPGTVVEMFPHIIPHAPTEESVQVACFMVAPLFAWYPDARHRGGDLGASFHTLDGKIGSDGAQRRFVALLRADAPALPTHLRHAITLLKAHDIGINWERLITDVSAWNRDNTTQRQWAQSFWGTVPEPSTSPAENAAPPQGEGETHDH